jgi:hypothetical protein
LADLSHPAEDLNQCGEITPGGVYTCHCQAVLLVSVNNHTNMILYLVLWIASLAIAIIVTRLVFDIPKFSRRSDTIAEASANTVELLKQQNELLTLLVYAAYDGKKIALVNKTTSSVKMVDVAELKGYDLSLYEVQVLSK